MMKKTAFLLLMSLSSPMFAGSDSAVLALTVAASSCGFYARDSTNNRPNYRRERVEAVRVSALTFLDEGIKSDALDDVIQECRLWLNDEQLSDDEIALMIFSEDSGLFLSDED